MDEPKVSFSFDFLNELEKIAFLKVVDATNTEEQAKRTRTFVEAFTKRGVKMKVILDALLEMYDEQRKESDNT